MNPASGLTSLPGSSGAGADPRARPPPRHPSHQVPGPELPHRPEPGQSDRCGSGRRTGRSGGGGRRGLRLPHDGLGGHRRRGARHRVRPGADPGADEVVGTVENVRVLHADATKLDWASTLGDPGAWTLCANLPYNVAVPVVMEVLASAPAVQRLVVMVQREVGERLAASPGDEQYGAVSVKVAYRARATRHPPRAVLGVLAEALGRLGGGAARPARRPRRSTWMPRPCGGWSTSRSPSDARRCATRCAASSLAGHGRRRHPEGHRRAGLGPPRGARPGDVRRHRLGGPGVSAGPSHAPGAREDQRVPACPGPA